LAWNLQGQKKKKICDAAHNDRTATVDGRVITCYNHSMEIVNVSLAELATLDIDWGFGPGDTDFPHDDNPWFDAEIADAP
jgi:myo-inositol catabolism protein IolC